MLGGDVWDEIQWQWVNQSPQAKRIAIFALGVIGLGLMVLAYRSHFKPQDIAQIATTSTLIHPHTITVHIAGEVLEPGLYTLIPPIRAIDAIALAGGLTPNANKDRLNLAKFLEDGTRLTIYPLPKSNRTAARFESRLAPSIPAAMGKVSINIASVSELETLPGIGPALAKRIETSRSKQGPFTSIEDLKRVKGIGTKLLNRMRDYLTL